MKLSAMEARSNETLAVEPVRFSVVILTYARDDALRTTLGLLHQAIEGRRDVEVILVDNNVDGVDRSSLLAAFPISRVVATGENKGVSARNDGMAVARGEFIALLDDDVLLQTPDFLDRFAAIFEERPDVGVVNVRKLEARTMTLLAECVPHTRKSIDTTKPFLTFRFIGGLVGLRREVFQALGGFNPDFFYGQEDRKSVV
jgi:GT2 family glycosyltransferase